MQIRTESGNRVNLSHLRNILLELPGIKDWTKPLDSNLSSVGTGREITYLDIALMDLMARYGMIDDRLVGIRKRGLQDENHLQDEMEASEGLSSQLELSLILERAKDIKSMDIGRGADVFCAAFVDEEGNQSRGISRLGAGGRLFQTEVRRGTSEADWTWNQVVVPLMYCCI